MKVLLKEDVDNLGYAGEVHDVANGFGRNFLLPQGLAVLATPGMMKQAKLWQQRAAARREELRSEYEALTARINDVRMTFTARAGETGKLYGSITTSQIADALNELLGTDIDRRKVGVEPLRQLGEHQVVVRLSGEFQPELTVVIEPEEGSEFTGVSTEIELTSDEVQEAEAERQEELEEVEAADEEAEPEADEVESESDESEEA